MNARAFCNFHIFFRFEAPQITVRSAQKYPPVCQTPKGSQQNGGHLIFKLVYLSFIRKKHNINTLMSPYISYSGLP